ncbi:MAG: penicillin-binding protein [Deltaproteobacteria bacterium]|nr:penicillin-binding protein [Deltaproteobacteria bacterium]
MQDLKHLSKKKRLSGLGFSGTGYSNKRLMPGCEKVSRSLRLPTGKRRERLKHLLLFLAVVLALTPVCLLALQKAPHAARGVTEWFGSRSDPLPKVADRVKEPRGSFETASLLLDSARAEGDRLTATAPTGETLHYTIQGDLQQRVHAFMAGYQVPYGVFVAIEPSTGRILAMTSHSSVDPEWARHAFFDLYPMASLFKIITASAALETRRITPQTVVEFRGNAYSENPRYWDASPRGKNNRMDVTHAMGKSINPVYGRIASDIAGKESVMALVSRFGFNQALLTDTPAKESSAGEPQSDHGLRLMGAGLDHEVKISPLHAAVIMAAIANGGRMMSPVLTDGSGATTPRELRRLVSPETAADLTRMLSSTVTSGTSRRAFHDRRGRPRLDVEIAAKTGSINGADPKGHYSWFAAFAPARSPRIALVALVINQDKWKIKASQVGERALQEFFER